MATLSGEEQPLPTFIQLHGALPQLMIDAPRGSDVGEYHIIVYGSIGNSQQTQAYSRFRVLVYHPSGIEVKLKPDFLVHLLSFQQIEIGKTVAYSPGPPVNADGALMTIEVDLGRAASFTEYRPVSNTLVVRGELMKMTDIGVHEFELTAAYQNETF